MSKRIQVSLAVASSVALIILTAPFVQGFRVETRLKKAFNEFNQTLAPAVTIESVNYRRDWYRSEVEAILSVRIATETDRFTMSLKLIHGPLPLLEIAQGNESFGLVGAKINGQLRPKLSAFKRAARGDSRAPIALQATIGLSARARATIKFTSFSRSDYALGWQKGLMKLSTADEFNNPSIQLRMKGLSLRYPGQKRIIQIGSVHVGVRPEPTFAQTTVEARLESLTLHDERWRIEATPISGLLKLKSGAGGLSAVTGSVTIERARALYRDYIGVSWRCAVSGVSGTSNMAFEKDKATFVNRYRIEKTATPKSAYGPISTLHNYAAIGAGAPTELWQAWSLWFPPERTPQTRAATALRSERSKAVARVQPLQLQADSLIKIKGVDRLSELKIESVQNKENGPNGYADGTGESLNRGSLHLDADEAIFNSLLYEVVDMTAQRSAYFEEEARADKSDAVRSLLKDFSDNHLIIEVPGGYQSTITWRDSLLRANERPLNLLNMVKLLAVRELILNPKLSLRIGRIESRGALGPERVKGPIKVASKKLVDCIWQQRSKASPLFRETIKVAWQINKKGEARISDTAFSTKVNASIKSCIQNIIESDIRYPRSSEETSASLEIRYEIVSP